MVREIFQNVIEDDFGYCCFLFDEKGQAIVYNLYVYAEYRRQGKAKYILQKVINEIKVSGYNGQILIEAKPREDSVDIENLIAFYKTMGLKVLNERR